MAQLLRSLAGAAGLALAAVAVSGPARADACAPHDGQGPYEAVKHMYLAASEGDADSVAALLAPDFFIFDDGQRHSGPELVARIKTLSEQGKGFAFDIISPDVRVDCNIAWITYENSVAVSEASGVRKASSLESAVLQWGDGSWKLSFLHSTTVPPARSQAQR